MKTVSLSGSSRKNVGKKDAATLRKEGRVPSVLYGGTEQVHFHVGAIDLKKIIYSPDVYEVQLDIDGKSYRAIIKEIQFHPVTDAAVHVDFLQMFEDKEITVDLPVRTTGNAIGVVNGGRLAMNFRKLSVRALPNAIPESITVNIQPLRIGHDIRVKDITIENGVILQPQNAVVVAVKRTRVAVMDDEDEEGEEGAEGAAEGGDAPAEGGEE